MDLKDRLQHIISKNNLSASSFADRLNIQRSNISHILSGRNKPSLDFIEKFINNFPEEDVVWLITGDVRRVKYIEGNVHADKKHLEYDNYEIKTKASESLSDLNILKSQSKITKIITFYEDKTFDVYCSNS
jgi:transcriptional regulator with XRE-family HTH domain